MRALATARPRLAHLSVGEPGLLGDDAWAALGTFPSLKTFSALPDDDSFFRPPAPSTPLSPLHMALLASSVTRPLAMTVTQSDAEVAASALKALQGAGNVGAGFITLHQREV